MPGFFVYNRDNVYPFQYHGEHLPNPTSTVKLSHEVDRLGRKKLAINLQFSSADVEGILRAHEHWDRYFRNLEIGRLEYLHQDLRQAVGQRLGADSTRSVQRECPHRHQVV